MKLGCMVVVSVDGGEVEAVWLGMMFDSEGNGDIKAAVRFKEKPLMVVPIDIWDILREVD